MNRSPSPASVTVTVPARLHLGFLDLNGGLGRRFGSIGLAINGLKTSITFNAASQPQVTGPESERVRGYLQAMQRALDIENTCHVRIDEVVPAHAGLGSGTQIALAVAAGVRRLHGLPLDVRGDAIRLERGARSGVGIGLFDHGGLVVDGGRGPLTTAAPVVSRMPFPEQWRILVVLDPHRQGVHGPDEREVFSKLAPSSDGQAAHLCRLVLMKALPALAEQRHCRLRFSDQGNAGAPWGLFRARFRADSRFSSPDVAAALAALEDEGAMASARAPGDRPDLPLRRPRRRRTVWSRASVGSRVPGSGHSYCALVSIAERISSVTWRRTSLSDTKDKNASGR